MSQGLDSGPHQAPELRCVCGKHFASLSLSFPHLFMRVLVDLSGTLPRHP